MADGFDGEIRLGVKLTPTDVKKTASQLQQEIEKIFNTSAGQKTSKQFQQMEIRLDGLYNKSQKLQESLKKMESNTTIPTKEYAEGKKELEQYEKALAKATAKRIQMAEAAGYWRKNKFGKTVLDIGGFSQNTEKGKKITEDISNYKSLVEQTRNSLRQMISEQRAFIDPTSTESYKQTALELNKTNNEIVKTISATEALQQQEKELPEPVQRTSQAAEHLKSAMSKVGNLISKVLHGLGNMTKALGGKIVSATKKLVGQFGKLGHHTDKHQLSLKKMARMMLKYGLGIRSVFLLWRKLRSYATEAIKTMARNFEEVDADVSMLMNSFNQMKNSMGTMVQPLLHALAPALNYIIGLITSAMNALANFFAILTGQKYIYKATKQNKSYADSLGGVGGAAKDANKELAEYDNLLVIKSQEEGSGGGGGGGADTGAGLFEKVEAESDFAKQLKDAINKGDWEGVGGLFADKLNIITKTFDNWVNKKFRPAGKKWAKRIGSIIGGFFKEWDSELSGKTLGDTLMAGFDIGATFFESTPWKLMGIKVAGAVNGLFGSWEPETVARFFSGKLNAVIDFAAGMFDPEKGINFSQAGTKLGSTIVNVINGIHWGTAGETLSNAAHGLMTFLSSFIDAVPPEDMAKAITDFLNGIDFSQLGKDLSDCAKKIINWLSTFVKNVPWEDMGADIADFLNNIDFISLGISLLDLAWNIIKGLVKGIEGLWTNSDALTKIGGALVGFIALANLGGLKDALTTSIAGQIPAQGWTLPTRAKIFLGVTLGLTLGTTVAKLFADFMESIGFKQYADEIRYFLKQPLKVIAEFWSLTVGKPATNVDEMTASVIQEAVQKLMAEGFSADDILKKLNYDELPEKIQVIIRDTLGIVDDGLEMGEKSIALTGEEVEDTVNDTKQNVITSAKDTITGIKTEWDAGDIKGYFTERSNDVTDSFNAVPSKLSTTFGDALNGVKTTFTQDALTEHFTGVRDNIETPFKELPTFFSDTFKESWNSAEAAFSDGEKTFNSFNSSISQGMTSTINGLIDGLNSVVARPFEKIQEIINKFRNIKFGVTSPFSSLPSFSGIPSIPHLAQGAVIPPNREFMAMLGDQTSGTNIETPLATMVQAFKQALSEMGSSNNQNIVLQLDGRTVAQCVWDEEDKRYKQTGRR